MKMSRELKKWCDDNSKPRRVFRPPKVSRGQKVPLAKILPRIIRISKPGPRYLVPDETLEQMLSCFMVKKKSLKYKATRRIKKLAEPQMRTDFIPQLTPSMVFRTKPAALRYKTSKRTEEMAKPYPSKIYKYVPDTSFQVKRTALSYSATPRIEDLSKPVQHPTDPPKEPGKVNKAALSASASPRTVEISQPRPRLDNNSHPHPFETSKAALSYVATERITTLAKPTHITPKVVPEPEYHFKH